MMAGQSPEAILLVLCLAKAAKERGTARERAMERVERAVAKERPMTRRGPRA